MSRPDPGPPLDLSGGWRAGAADEELRRNWFGADFDDADFVDIDVPGHWRSNPTFAQTTAPLLYRRRFSALTPTPGSRAWLVLDGVCAQGDVWLDESYLGNTDGAWVPHRFEVTEALTARNDHVLGIEVASPTTQPGDPRRDLLGTLMGGPHVATDWNPAGIWRPVRIRRTGPVSITAHRVVCTSASAANAVVRITCTLDAAAAGQVTIRTVVGDVAQVHHQPLAGGTNTVTWTVAVPDPDLWWPYELGDQPLTEIAVAVSAPGDPAATDDPAADGVEPGAAPEDFVASDSFRTRCGLRQVTLDDWICTVNGERLFLRGVLAGPAAQDLATAPADAVTAPIRQARQAGCNLVRVHAHIARDELYDAADREGMLIWQDLPLYRGMHRSVKRTAMRTAEATVDRLGAHPSIAVWCGHDEPDHQLPPGEPAGFGRRLVAHQLPNWNRTVLDRGLKRTLAAADPSRAVIGSSGTWPHPPSLAGTDTHLELGWSHGEAADLARLARALPRAVRFVQLTPNPSPPVAFAHDGPWPPADPADLVGDRPVSTTALEARLPPDAFTSADQWRRAAHELQARLVRTQVETLRRLKYRPTGGFVVAHLADLQPGPSPSLIDHTGQPKPAFAALQAACAPLLASLHPWPECALPGETLDLELHLVDDTREAHRDARCEIRITFTGPDGADTGDTRHWEFGGDIDADDVTLVGRLQTTVPDHVTRVDASVVVTAGRHRTVSHTSAPVHRHPNGP